MGQPDGVEPFDGDEAVRLGAGDGVGARQRDDLLQPQWLAEGEVLDRAPLVGRQAVHPRTHELGERGAGRRLARQPPDASDVLERGPFDAADEHQPQVERVAPGVAVEPPPGTLLDGTAEHGLDERRGGVLGQRPQLDAHRAGVLPQRLHGVGCGRTRPHGDDDERDAGHGELEDERRRAGVEQLRVVDAEDDLAAARALAQGLGAPAHQLERLVGACVGRHEAGEGAERYGGRAAGCLHPARERALALRPLHGMARQA